MYVLCLLGCCCSYEDAQKVIARVAKENPAIATMWPNHNAQKNDGTASGSDDLSAGTDLPAAAGSS